MHLISHLVTRAKLRDQLQQDDTSKSKHKRRVK